jgi:dolichyl-phosphate-mannose--protein O-mannosyl transferase
MSGTLTSHADVSGEDGAPLPEPPDHPAGERPSVRERLLPPMPRDGWWGWGGPLAVTAVGAALRFWNLGQPHVFSFDETYYAKDGLSLIRFGYEQVTLASANDKILAGNSNVFTGMAEYVVHPPVGKWAIGLGQWIFGATPFGWRFVPAVIGTLMILMLARIVRRMTRSTLVGCIAGLLLALDSLSIVLSRTALLDGTLAFFVLAGFGALVIDRDRSRARLADWAEQRELAVETGPGDRRDDHESGPWLGARPWRIAAGVLLGLACATKWSGLWFLLMFAVMSLCWDWGARRAAGVRWPFWATVTRDAVQGLVSLLPVAAVVYVLAWVPWLITFSDQKRDWDLSRGGPGFLPDNVRALIGYHEQMYDFHTHLTSGHPYAAKAVGWLLQLRPTAFWSVNLKTGEGGCTATSCVREVTSIGTPAIWWAATAAIIWLVWRWIGARDWRAGAALAGIAAGWAPWLGSDRTIFTFYEVCFAPFMIIGLTLVLSALMGDRTASSNRRFVGTAAVGIYLLLVVADTAWLWPVLVGDLMSNADWFSRMWFRSWI